MVYTRAPINNPLKYYRRNTQEEKKIDLFPLQNFGFTDNSWYANQCQPTRHHLLTWRGKCSPCLHYLKQKITLRRTKSMYDQVSTWIIFFPPDRRKSNGRHLLGSFWGSQWRHLASSCVWSAWTAGFFQSPSHATWWSSSTNCGGFHTNNYTCAMLYTLFAKNTISWVPNRISTTWLCNSKDWSPQVYTNRYPYTSSIMAPLPHKDPQRKQRWQLLSRPVASLLFPPCLALFGIQMRVNETWLHTTTWQLVSLPSYF